MKADGGTTATQDAPPEAGQPSTGKGDGTSAGSPKTYTEAELQEAVRKRTSDRLAEAGRKAKQESESLQSQIKASNDTIAALQKQLDDAEDGHFKNNPDALTVSQMRRQLRDERAKLLQEKTELDNQRKAHQTELDEAKSYRVLRLAEKVAEGYTDVDPQELVDLTDGSQERMEVLAKRIGVAKDAKTGEATWLKPDSGVTSGSGVDISKMTAREKIEAGLKKK